ncbi:hypothetical protein FACS189419_05750 [Planctomycetales bacterium]|nr:hypothetical protein FACS189419_05750 [Planctomycetales bacterium]
MSKLFSDSVQKRGEFDDALKGYYQDHDEILPEENTDYRSLTAESVGSLILGILSLLTFISGIFVVFPLLGIILGTIAVKKILRASQELGGLGFASAGVALSVVFAGAGLTYQYYVSSFEVPPGYISLTFADLASDPATGQIPENIIALVPHIDAEGNEVAGTPVFIEGYMFPTRQRSEITDFILVPSIEQNKFGSATRNPTEMIEVSLRNDITAEYKTNLVRVGGLLLVKPKPKPGEIPYQLEADVLRY